MLAEQGADLVPHLSRVALLAGETGARLGLSIDQIAQIRLAAELHDIGKAAVPGVILDKPGPLDATELAYLRQHSLIGERILSAAPALANVAPLVRATHERPDGAGYPDGLRLEQIPVGARVIAVVDAFDAMTTQLRTSASEPSTRRSSSCGAEPARSSTRRSSTRSSRSSPRVIGTRGTRFPRTTTSRSCPALAVSAVDTRRRGRRVGRRARRG